jgi:hypothetical protein
LIIKKTFFHRQDLLLIRKKHTMKTLQRPKVTRQIRVIRVTRPSVVHPIERADSRIPSVSIDTNKIDNLFSKISQFLVS